MRFIFWLNVSVYKTYIYFSNILFLLKTRAVKRLIASKIKVCVYIIYVRVVCIIILYI